MPVQYSRFFITLRQESSGYEYNGRSPMGRCIVEARGSIGKVSVTVQDIRPEIIYKVYLVAYGSGSSAGFPAGTLHVDKKGKAELRCEFDPENVGGSGLSIDSFNVVAVVASSKTGIVSPLIGYKDSPVPWKNNFRDLSDKRNNVESPPAPLVMEEITDKKEVEVAETETAETTAAPVGVLKMMEETTMTGEAYDISEDITLTTEVTTIIEEVAVTIEAYGAAESADGAAGVTVEESGELPEDDIVCEEIAEEEPVTAEIYDAFAKPDASVETDQVKGKEAAFDNGQYETEKLEYYRLEDEPEKWYQPENSQNDTQTINTTVSQENVAHGTELDFVLNNNTPIIPFKRQNREVKWVRISMKETALLPENYQPIIHSQFVTSGYSKYNHFILGETGDISGSFYILGVPGIYEADSRPLAFRLGFSQFKCCEDIKPLRGDYGYWLLPILIN